VGAELVHPDGWTDSHDETNRRFSRLMPIGLEKKRKLSVEEFIYEFAELNLWGAISSKSR
jgi:hypothetical protein